MGNQPRAMIEMRFLHQIFEEYNAGQRFCFILGAGASRTSGIRTGEELMLEWRVDLARYGMDYIQDSARELGLDAAEYEPLFKDDYQLKSKDYFTLFDLRFAGRTKSASAYLEKEMADKSPNFGYYPLATILSHTENRLVITTNFDSFVEDSIYNFTAKHPVSVVHERLADFIDNDLKRPIVAKIHRGLFFHPMNRKVDMQQLANEWKTPLSSALKRYIPIVIGYAGGDQTLMSLLQTLQLPGLYWCYVNTPPSQEICNIVQQQRGYLVKILGFDEIMFQIANCFQLNFNLNDSCDFMRAQAEVRCLQFLERLEQVKSKYEVTKTDSDSSLFLCTVDNEECNETKDSTLHNSIELKDSAVSISHDEEECVASLLSSLDEYKSAPFCANTGNKFIFKASAAFLANKIVDAIDYCDQAIAAAPNCAQYYEKRSTFLHQSDRYTEALADASKAIELDPENASYYNSRALTLRAMKRYEEALSDHNKAIMRTSQYANYFYERFVTLCEVNRYNECLLDVSKAIKLDPNNANYYYGRAMTQQRMMQFDKAFVDIIAAIKLDPNNSLYYSGRSVILRALGRPDEAMRDEKKARNLAIAQRPRN